MSEFNEPWRYVEHCNAAGDETPDDDFNGGAFLSVNGDVICWFGNYEMYYPTAGSGPASEESRRMVACVNFCRDMPTKWLETHVATGRDEDPNTGIEYLCFKEISE